MTSSPETTRRERGGILAPAYLATTVGVFALIAFNAFEAMAVTTVMPTISRDLDGLDLFALAFAAPLASGVVGMVAAGSWSDRRGPALPLVVSLVLFSLGVLTCGLAPSMEVFVAGRVVQGLGTGALIVSLYVVVGVVYPSHLQPSIFASFAAAWVLPSLFGPAVAAFVAGSVGWRWVFLGVVGLVAVAAVLIAPVVRGLRSETDGGTARSRSRLGWAVLAAVAVLAVEVFGSLREALPIALGGIAAVVTVVAVRPLMPRHTLRARRGLPSVIGTRGLMSATFFCGQAYIVLVLQERWSLSPGQSGIALTVVGVVWASASQVQARLGQRLTSERAMTIGCSVLLGAAAGDVAVGPARPVPAGRRRLVRGRRRRHGTRLHPDRRGDAGRIDGRRPRLQLLGPHHRRLDRGRARAGALRHRVRRHRPGRRRPVPRGVRHRGGLLGRRARDRDQDGSDDRSRVTR